MTDFIHLTEEDRQTLADGTMPEPRAREAEAHLRECGACTADVDALRRVVSRLQRPSVDASPADEMWPDVRLRIEQAKLVPLHPGSRVRERAKRTPIWIASGLAAAMIVIGLLASLNSVHRKAAESAPSADAADVADAGVPLTAVNDSVRSYEAEARILLDRLELERATIGPTAMAPLDRDLAVIDRAIAELQAAIASDPNNPALRRLLAASYRQKVDLLRRARNAG